MIIRNCDIFPIKVIFEDGEIVKLYPGKAVGDDKKVNKIFSFFDKELIIPEIHKTQNDLCLVNIYNEKFNAAKILIYAIVLLITFISINGHKTQSISLDLFSCIVIILSLIIYLINGISPQLTFVSNEEEKLKIIDHMDAKNDFFIKTRRRFIETIISFLIILFAFLTFCKGNHLIEKLTIYLYIGIYIILIVRSIITFTFFGIFFKFNTRYYDQDAGFSFILRCKYLYLSMITSVIMLYYYIFR